MQLIFQVTVVATVLSVAQSCDSCVDQTRIPGAIGATTVLASVRLVKHSNIFSEEYGTLRRIAYAETEDGSLYEPGSGGIWKVSDEVFYSTKNSSGTVLTEINSFFLIVWDNVTYEDLDKPLFSALAASIFIQDMQNSGNISISTVNGQIDLWLDYNTMANETYYYDAVEKVFIDDSG